MNYQEQYKQKLRKVEDVVKLIKSGDIIGAAQVPLTPKVFLGNLHRVDDNVTDIQVYSSFFTSPFEFETNKKYEGRFLYNSWFYGAPDRAVIEQGIKTVNYIPYNAHSAIKDFVQTGKKLKYFACAASPMDEKGYFSLSLCAFIEKDLMEAAEQIILEINPNLPRTCGETEVHISQVSYLIEVDYKIPEEVLIKPTEVEEKISTYVADMVEDGATLQMGIGGVPYAVSKLLVTKKDLGIHTEMFTEGMLELYEQGVITNKKKTLWKDKFICAFAYGTTRLYDFVKDNPAVMIMRGSYTNHPEVMGKNYKMTSINSALMVDLTGNVVSEAIGARQFSGTGGALDTHRGAVISARNGLGGKGIIAIRSTAKNDTVTKVVPYLPLGSPVTIPRQEVDYIVTEFGVAALRGRPMFERVRSLIAIAHPNHRADLKREAEKIGLL